MAKIVSSGSRNPQVPVWGKTLIGVTVVLLAIAVSVLGYAAVIMYLKRAHCVVLPDGSMIGHVAVFKLEPDPDVDMLLWDSSGRIVLRQDGFVNFEFHPFDANRVLLKMADVELDLDASALMPAVLNEKSSWGYVRKWRKIMKGGAGGTHIVGTGLYAIYERLRLHPSFETVTCGTPWFDRGG
ncbi:MAG: hypothetical protein AAF967_08880 [Pseudomonadota bacterium]